MYSFIIVGGGVAGASTAYQLYNLKNFNKKVLLVEAGVIGEGSWDEVKTDKSKCHLSNEPEGYRPWLSGTNVFDMPNRIKMIITVVPISAQEWVKHHGKKGIELFNKLSILGREEQFRLAEVYLNTRKDDISNPNVNEMPDDLTHSRLGSLMICKQDEVDEMYEDYRLLKEAGYEVDWWDNDKVIQMHGKDIDYHSGMFFPKDGAIFSSLYAKKLVEQAKKKGLEVRDKTTVKDVVEDKKDGKNVVKVILENNEVLYAERVIMCTGGLYMDKYLGGILKPVYSYLTGLKAPVDYTNLKGNSISTMKNTPNFLTHKFLCDYNMAQGWLRISGEDHYSSSLHSRTNHRGKEMEEWVKKRYPFLRNSKEIKYINGVCSESPDYLPLVGNAFDGSNIYYNLCCGGWGQAVLSATSYLMPGVLGERELNKDEKELVNFVNIRRYRLGNNKFQVPKF